VHQGEDRPSSFKVDATVVGIAAAVIIGLAAYADDPAARWLSGGLLAVGGVFIVAQRRLRPNWARLALLLLSLVGIVSAVWISVASDDDATSAASSDIKADAPKSASPSPTPTPPDLTPTPAAVTPDAPVEEPELAEIMPGTSHDFFDGSLLLGVTSVYSTSVRVNLSTEVDDCSTGTMEVGERAVLEGELAGVPTWFRITVIAVSANTSATVRAELFDSAEEQYRSCPY